MDYIGTTGKVYTTIEPALGKGGEGSIYKIQQLPNCVLKVFLPVKRTESRHKKLLAMIASNLPDDAMNQITWPIDIAYENGQFAGYIMPAIKNNEDLNVMYSDKYVCTLSEKITIAKNLCAAINAVHNANQVCGDLNPKNIGVDPKSARVTLVDTDSYHITEGSRVYRCEVGLPEYLPREIQEKMKNGQTLATTPLPTFSKYSDLFALAVHIFALLMNGCHPFACAINNKHNIGILANSQPSVTAPQPIDNICNGFFPFYTKKSGITTPKYAPDFDALPTHMQNLFVRAFVDGHIDPRKRPDTVEWYNALTTMQQNLSTCSKNKSHMYPSHLKKCIWCEIENRMNAVMVANATPQITQTVINTQIQKANTSIINNPTTSTPLKSNGIMASSGMFWFLTLAITLAVQAIVHSTVGDELLNALWGTRYGSGFESWGVNLAIWLGPWGFMICGVAGTLLYNCLWCTSGQLYGYKWYHYVLSCLVSFICSAAYILLIFLISLAIMLIVAAIIIAIICGIFSGC